YLNRTHPFVDSLASWLLATALDPIETGVARRCGVIRTSRVQRRTALILARCRYHLITIRDGREKTLLAEEAQILGFAGAPDEAVWLEKEAVEALLDARPEANVAPEQARQLVSQILASFDPIRSRLAAHAAERSVALLQAHDRVRTAARLKGVQNRVEPVLPPDVLGIYLYLPV
ncbi:MAG TPA: ATP-dependent helicase, partial [bacterium]|nr:ATP-dependent helicase [bacterium]